MSDALLGYGTTFKVFSSGSYQEVGEVFAIEPPSTKVDVVDASHEGAPDEPKEYLPGKLDEGECSISLNFVPGSAGMNLLRALLRETVACRITFPNAIDWDFDAFITEISGSVPHDDKMTANVSFKISGTTDMGPSGSP